MCQFGLQVVARGLNKKPTGILTNHPGIIRELSGHLCAGGHRHAVLEGSQQTSRAAKYTPKFVKKIARAVTDQWSGASARARPTWAELSEAFPAADDGSEPPGQEQEAEAEGSESSGDEPETRVDRRKAEVPSDPDPSEEEKRLIFKLHVNMGHPDSRKFCRVLRAGG
eukprot:4505745-Pyramimonas_sp.AAC.1